MLQHPDTFSKLLCRRPAVFLASYGELSEARINTGLDSQNERFKITAKLIFPSLPYPCLFVRGFDSAAWLG